VIHLDNDAVRSLLTMDDAIAAIRIGLAQLADGEAAHVPRLELWSPSDQADGYHCLGSMAGTTKHFGLTAIRIKSDVIRWPEGARHEKHALRPGTYCGFILLFSTATGEPVALINDGIIQQMRVGASAAVAVDHLADPDPVTLGVIGSGSMARSHLEAITSVRPLRSVRVFSPTEANRRNFAADMARDLGVHVEAVDDAEAAVEGCGVIVTATNSMGPTVPVESIGDGSLVTCVTRREVGPNLIERADRVIQLGAFSIGPEAGVPGMEFPQSGAGGFVAGNDTERARLPWRHRAETRTFPGLVEVVAGRMPARERPEDVVVFLNIGLQGVQFAAVAGRLYERALEEVRGTDLPVTPFLQTIRD